MKKRLWIIVLLLVFSASTFILGYVHESKNQDGISSIKVYKAMLDCKIHPAKEIKMRIGANDYKIPLPAATAKVQEGVFVTDASNLQEYLEETLPESGWKKCDSFGNVHVIKRDDEDVTVLFLAKPYSKSCVMMNFKSL